ncbi:MAG: isochorismatase family protein [Armatimonadota bacterium]
MPTMRLNVRRRRMMKVSDPNHEANFHTDQIAIELDALHTGFVLVDMWDCSDVPDEIKPGGVSFCRRAAQITALRVAPALDAAREAGLTVIHAPTSYVAEKYAHSCRGIEVAASDAQASPGREWPPPERREAWAQECWAARYSDYGPEENRARVEGTRILPQVEPIESDWLIASSEQMHAICRQERLLNLIYVGFATNMCLVFKPGALLEMSGAGYRCVVLRDCTTAVENADSHGDLAQTRAFVDWFEMQMLAYTTTSAQFIAACAGAAGA